MTDLLGIQEEHAELCAKAQELGIEVPSDLAVDFATVEAGRTVCASLKKLIRANAPETEEATDQAPKPKAKPAAKKKAAKPAKATKPKAKQESAMSTATKSKTKKATKKAAPKKAAKKSNGENKTAKVIALMKRAKGVTREEVLKLTGWKAVSMQQLAKSSGIKMKVEDKERPFHYKAA